MAIVDKKGRLFGWVNLLDLVIILAILAVGARFVNKAMHKPQVVQESNIQVSFIIDNVRPATLDGIRTGMKVQDRKSLATLGTVVNVQTQKAIVQGPAAEYESPSRISIIVTVEGPGRVTPDGGAFLNNIETKVGLQMSIGTPEWAGNATVYTVPKAPQQ